MSFQAYLDNIEAKTGKTPRELLAEAKTRGFDGPETKAERFWSGSRATTGLAAATRWPWST